MDDVFAAIRRYDGAIDMEAMKEAEPGGTLWEQWLDSADTSLLIFHEGQAPAKYHCRVLSRDQRKHMRGMEAVPANAQEYAFQCCMAMAENVFLRDGTRGPWQPAKPGKPMSDAEVKAWPERDVREIGAQIIARSFCDPREPVYVPLPATSQLGVIAAGIASRRHRAAQMKEQAARLSGGDKPPPAAQRPMTPTPSPDGATPGDATATE